MQDFPKGGSDQLYKAHTCSSFVFPIRAEFSESMLLVGKFVDPSDLVHEAAADLSRKSAMRRRCGDRH